MLENYDTPPYSSLDSDWGCPASFHPYLSFLNHISISRIKSDTWSGRRIAARQGGSLRLVDAILFESKRLPAIRMWKLAGPRLKQSRRVWLGLEISDDDRPENPSKGKPGKETAKGVVFCSKMHLAGWGLSVVLWINSKMCHWEQNQQQQYVERCANIWMLELYLV